MENNKKITRSAAVLRVAETILCVVVLALAINITSCESYSDTMFNVCTAAFGFIIFADLVKIYSAYKETGKVRVDDAAMVVILAAEIIVAVFFRSFGISADIMFITYCGALCFKRVASVIYKPKPVNISMNIFGVLLAGWLFTGVYCDPEEHDFFVFVFIALGIGCQMLARAMKLAMSHTRYDILLKVVRKSMALEILAGLIVLLVAFSFVLNFLERDTFPTFGDALWYCYAVVTTIGFGDFAATTLVGRIITVVMGIYGIIVVAIITSVIVNFYTELKSEEKTEGAEQETVADGNKESGSSDTSDSTDDDKS